MKNTVLVIMGFILVLCSCKEEKKELLTGDWWAKMMVSENEELPFTFKLSKMEDGSYQMEIHNAEEVVVVDEITVVQDSIILKMPVFEGYIAGTFSEDKITGSFIKESLNRVVPFSAVHGTKERFSIDNPSTYNVSGIWETYFEVDTDDEYPAKGIFIQEDNVVKGTFRTKTGDYRFLEGVMDGDSLKLSAFDGAHVFLFTAKVTDSTLSGKFYSGNHSLEMFKARRNEAFELPDANTLTFLRDGYESFDFSFPDETGKIVSLSDERFAEKPVLIQIMGTWCPNCLDETKFYVDYLKKNPDTDLAFVALAFEYAKTEESAWRGIQRLKDRIEVPYPILLAQYGTSNKQRANEKLPMLNHVLSYPTTIYIDRDKDVRKIHTGFNGPATGEKHENFKKEFNQTVEEMLEMEMD
nr:TlpA disulfide reductase family protein [Allomuricauda sp.]